MLPYRHRPHHTLRTEAIMTKETLRQLSLLEGEVRTELPPEVEAKALELLVQLLIEVMPALQTGAGHEQN
jgi:hypothetical protein